jgi:DNA-binding response OmpR family regulator
MNARILVADDEQPLAEMLAAILEHSAFKALVAFSGDVAFEMTLRERPAVVLLDHHLHPHNGYQLAHQIRDFLPETQIILSTGDPDVIPAGPFAVFAKPFHPTELLPLLPGLLERYEKLAQQVRSSTWEWDVDSNALRWAPSSCDSFGEPASVIDLNRWKHLVDPKEFPDVWASLQRAVQTGDEYRAAYRIVEHGEGFVIESRGKTYKNSAGRVCRILGTNYRRAS